MKPQTGVGCKAERKYSQKLCYHAGLLFFEMEKEQMQYALLKKEKRNLVTGQIEKIEETAPHAIPPTK